MSLQNDSRNQAWMWSEFGYYTAWKNHTEFPVGLEQLYVD